jgi:Protein of unknown function (DUF3467)
MTEAELNKDAEEKNQKCADAAGIYVNHLAIGHNMSEIVMEFGQILDEAKSHRQARLITSPTHLRSFQALMTDTIERYEDEFGPLAPINLPEQEH